MSGADKLLPLTKAAARRIWLAAQRLDSRNPFGQGPQAVARKRLADRTKARIKTRRISKERQRMARGETVRLLP